MTAYSIRSTWGASMLAISIAMAGGVTTVRAENLQDALAATYRYNPRLDAARAALRATDEEVARANSGYRPTVTAAADSGAQWQTSKSTTGMRRETELHPSGYRLDATQPLFRGFRTLNSVREAEATIRAGRENLRTVEQSVLLEAVTAYMDTLRDAAIVKIRENNVEVLSRELRATQERFKVGEVTRTDVAQAEARRAGTVSALDLARANLKTSRGNYERTVGRAPGNLAEPRPPKRRLPQSLQEAIAMSARENPGVIAALYREQGARSTVDRIWGELLPTVQIESSYQRRFDTSDSVAETETTSVVARATVPLYTSGEVQARVRQAKHTHVSRIQEIEQNRSEVQAQVVQSWSQLQAADAQFVSDNAQVKALEIALAGVREEEKVGQRTLLDILNAEQELLNAQVNLASTKRNINVAAYSLLSTVGRLNIQELGASDEVYDAELHYHEIRRKWWGVSITRAHGKSEYHDFWDRIGKIFHASHGENVEPPAKPAKSKPVK